MKFSRIDVTVVLVVAVCAVATAGAQLVTLRPASAFSPIPDQRARSVALFEEAAKVITSPRCLNCHPSTRQPTQGDDMHPHLPPVYGGPHDEGVPGLPCSSCHGPSNAVTRDGSIASIPGDAHWKLAPASMAWQGKSIREICLQLQDPSRNGGRTLSKIQEHMATDSLVGWAWNPGEGRSPAPGTQAQFGALIAAWIATGAECPQR
jgi:hypothetical protein